MKMRAFSRKQRPEAVIWYVLTRRFVEETSHSAFTDFAFSSRWIAG
jgi:hypothetical protein